MARFQLAAFGTAGADTGRLAREAQLPEWALATEDVMVSPRYAMRLWELAEHALALPCLALTAAARHQVGELSLYDYLFTTAATLRDGLAASSRYLPLLTTNGRLRVESQSDRETTYSYDYRDADGRGADLSLQLSVAVFCLRAREGTGRPVVPVHVAFAQDAPPSHGQYAEVLGTSRIDFGAPVTTFTFRARDLDLPMRGADPQLERILRQYAAGLPAPAVESWQDYFRQHIAAALRDGPASLQALAWRLRMSPRTLQRRLAEQGTTWRAELDAVRRELAPHIGQPGMPGDRRLVSQLGYASPRSLRHARRRWAGHDAPPASG